MIIILNGKHKEVAADLTVAALLKAENIPTKGTAVAVNDALVSADQHNATRLKDGDNVLIISAAYGG